jgi:dihydrofolate reductase
MRKLYLYMTMTLDGFIAGPKNELDWMVQATDQEMNDDTVAILSRADDGIMGYPTASGMIPYWSNVAKNQSASKGERAIAQAVNGIHGIVVSNKEEKLAFENAELLVAKDDKSLVEAIRRIKERPGRDIGLPGGVRTAQKFVRLGLVDEYDFMMHPIAIGDGKRLFTQRVSLEVVKTKRYSSGVMFLCYRPR